MLSVCRLFNYYAYLCLMTNDEIFDIIRWTTYTCKSGIIAIERLDNKTETYPTPLFFINSINICRELIEDINLN